MYRKRLEYNEESAHRHTLTPRFGRLRCMNERNLAREEQKLILKTKDREQQGRILDVPGFSISPFLYQAEAYVL